MFVAECARVFIRGILTVTGKTGPSLAFTSNGFPSSLDVNAFGTTVALESIYDPDRRGRRPSVAIVVTSLNFSSEPVSSCSWPTGSPMRLIEPWMRVSSASIFRGL